MITAHVEYKNEKYFANLQQPIDISIPLRPDGLNPNCFYAPPPTSSPVKSGDFVGSIQQGGLVNFKNVKINPHGNGTHTECYAHIHPSMHTVNEILNPYFFPAQLVSLYPTLLENGDRVISQQHLMLLEETLAVDIPQKNILPPALIIRTLPNSDDKLQRNYSGTNPPYVTAPFLKCLRENGVQHLLIDLPSVDREQDEGKLAGHKAFWNIEGEIQHFNTITELIYAPSMIPDGLYLLQISICPLEMDATPSKPILYELKK